MNKFVNIEIKVFIFIFLVSFIMSGMSLTAFASPVVNTEYFGLHDTANREYQIEIENNGAEIPTYIATGSSFKLPGARLCHINDNNEKEYFDEALIIFNVNGAGTLKANRTVFADSPGLLFIEYTTKLLNDDKFYHKEFIVRVRDDFKDTTIPTLSIFNVPTSASINVKTILPLAKATDDFDDNLLVKVAVSFNDEAVLEAIVDENTSYAIDVIQNKPIKFNNYDVFSFYPTRMGTYIVSYQAIDDSGNKSVLHEYKLECSDKTPPEFRDYAIYQIPNIWGRTVINNKGSLGEGTLTKDNLATATTEELAAYKGLPVLFPFPEIYDNNDVLEDLILSFRITDPEQRIILNFTNILHALNETTGTTGHKTGNINYDNGEQVFTKNGFLFDFQYYTLNNIGKFTVLYRARDSKGNANSTQEFVIELAESLIDEEAPIIDKINDIDQILIGNNGNKIFTVPTPFVSDNKDNNPKITYTLSFNEKSITCNHSEILDIKQKGGNFYLVGKSGSELKIDAGEMVFTCDAIDSAGNISNTEMAIITINLVPVDQYTYIFYYEDGITVLETATVDSGTIVTPPANLEKEGYIFIGWYKDIEFTVEYTASAITSDLYIYAKFEKNQPPISNCSNISLDNINFEFIIFSFFVIAPFLLVQFLAKKFKKQQG